MYIVAIGWAYVILMMAITASSVGKAIAILLFMGILPLALFVYAFGGRKHRSVVMPNEVADERDRTDTKPD